MKSIFALSLLISASAFAQMGSGSPISDSIREEIRLRNQEDHRNKLINLCSKLHADSRVEENCGAPAHILCDELLSSISLDRHSEASIRRKIRDLDCQ